MSASLIEYIRVLGCLAILTCAGAAPAQARPADPGAGLRERMRVLAERGDARAQTRLGLAYQTGRGEPQNYVVAAYWFDRAARRGLPAAQFLLGLLYDRGLGVPLDPVVAEKWLVLAAGGSSGREQDYYARIRDSVASTLSRKQILEAQRLAYLWSER